MRGPALRGRQLQRHARAARRLTQAQRRQIGQRRRRGSTSTEIPGYETFRLLLMRLDIEIPRHVLSAWLGEHRGTLPAHLALDGKHIREHLGTIVTFCDIPEQVPVAVRAMNRKRRRAKRLTRAAAQRGSPPARIHREPRRQPRERPDHIVQEKGDYYLISLKNNQPTLHDHATAQFAGAPFLPPSP